MDIDVRHNTGCENDGQGGMDQGSIDDASTSAKDVCKVVDLGRPDNLLRVKGASGTVGDFGLVIYQTFIVLVRIGLVLTLIVLVVVASIVVTRAGAWCRAICPARIFGCSRWRMKLCCLTEPIGAIDKLTAEDELVHRGNFKDVGAEVVAANCIVELSGLTL